MANTDHQKSNPSETSSWVLYICDTLGEMSHLKSMTTRSLWVGFDCNSSWSWLSCLNNLKLAMTWAFGHISSALLEETYLFYMRSIHILGHDWLSNHCPVSHLADSKQILSSSHNLQPAFVWCPNCVASYSSLLLQFSPGCLLLFLSGVLFMTVLAILLSSHKNKWHVLFHLGK